MADRRTSHARDLLWLILILLPLAAITEFGDSVWNDPYRGWQRLLAYGLGLGLLALVWLYESRSPASEGSAAVLFIIAAGLIAYAPGLRVVLLPHGASFDSFAWHDFEEVMGGLFAGAAGLYLSIRGIIRSPDRRKVLGVVALALLLVIPLLLHDTTNWVAAARGLRDVGVSPD